MKAGKLIGILIAAGLLSSCSYLHQSRDNDYLTAKSVQPLRIPPGLTSDSFENYHPIPDHTYPEASKTVSLMPPGLSTKS